VKNVIEKCIESSEFHVTGDPLNIERIRYDGVSWTARHIRGEPCEAEYLRVNQDVIQCTVVDNPDVV
jgi:hypothetical protein